MYISKLELKGFKSFANKTSVQLSSGITAVVGPNGCGKSNIVDALRWVLGEQRASQLRSTNMTNVIFNGTKNKKQAGFAEVSLTLKNDKGVLPMEYDEVTITRRLFRSGQSEYYLNQTPCRLKDINELFMDTGMGSNTYSVIELKAVEGIVDDKNNDRRKLFEEAAGVTKYKEKRKSTYRKLEETKGDLQRLEDVLLILEKKVKSLEQQASKAKRYKAYEAELNELDIQAAYFEFHKLKSEINPIIEQLERAEVEKKEIVEKLEILENKYKSLMEDSGLQLETEEIKQRELSQQQQTLNELDTRLKVTIEKEQSESRLLDQLNNQMANELNDIDELQAIAEQNRHLLDGATHEFKLAQEGLTKAKTRFDELLNKLNETRRAAESENKGFVDVQREINSLRSAVVKGETRLENLHSERKRLEQDEIQLNESLVTLDQDMTRIDGELKSKQKESQEYEQDILMAEEEIELIRKQIDTAKDNLRHTQSDKRAAENEWAILDGIAHSNEAFPRSVQYLLEKADTLNISTLSTVVDLISAEDTHAKALEAVLGHRANQLVVQTVEEAEICFNALKETKKGRIGIWVLDLIPKIDAKAGSLASLVKPIDKAKDLTNLLLSNVFYVDQQSLTELLPQYDAAAILVNNDGVVVTKTGLYTDGSEDKNLGVRSSLKQKMDTLQTKVEQLSKDFEKHQNELNEKQEMLANFDVKEMRNELRELNKTIQQLQKAHHSAVAKYESAQDRIANFDLQRQRLDKEEKELSVLLEEEKIQLNTKEQHLEQLSGKNEDIKSQIASLEEEKNLAQRLYNDNKLKEQDLRNKKDNYVRDLKRAESSNVQLAEKVQEKKDRILKAGIQIESLKQEIEQLTLQKEELRLLVNQASEELRMIKQQNADLRGQLKQLDDEIKDLQRKKEVNTDLSHHLSMARQNLEMQLKGVSDHVWETYGKLIQKLEVEVPQDFDLAASKKRVTWLRQRIQNMGQINALAIDEYEEEKEKLEFYHKQIADVEEAEEQLLQTLEEINTTAINKFNTTFEVVRNNFITVFKTLFNEDDECDLVIDQDADDPLEARINIIAKPRGKRPSNISQLSGGEKTLTATALLFSIYLVKPSPFCVLDEVDAPLDDANVERFANMIKRFKENTQFIMVTHNKNSMANAERLYGVTMPELGVSQLVAVDVEDLS